MKVENEAEEWSNNAILVSNLPNQQETLSLMLSNVDWCLNNAKWYNFEVSNLTLLEDLIHEMRDGLHGKCRFFQVDHGPRLYNPKFLRPIDTKLLKYSLSA